MLRKAARLDHTKEVATAMDAEVASSATRLRFDHTCMHHAADTQPRRLAMDGLAAHNSVGKPGDADSNPR